MLTAKEFGVDRRWIREWREERYMLQQNMIGEKKTKRKLHQGREVRSIEIDQAVLLFLDEERAEGRVVRNKDLRQKANEIAGGLGLQDFSASQMWLKRWEQRHSVCTRKSTHTSQKVPDDFEEHLFDNFRVSILWQKSTWLPTTFHSEYGPNDGSFWYGPQSYKWAKRGEASENQDCKRPKTGIYCGSVCICQWCKIPSHNCLEGEKWAHPTVCFSQPSNSCKCSYPSNKKRMDDKGVPSDVGGASGRWNGSQAAASPWQLQGAPDSSDPPGIERKTCLRRVCAPRLHWACPTSRCWHRQALQASCSWSVGAVDATSLPFDGSWQPDPAH